MPQISSPFFVSDRRRLLVAASVLLGLGEFADAFAISFWEGAAVFSLLFLAAAAWTRRGGISGPILVGALCVFELQSFPTWARTGSRPSCAALASAAADTSRPTLRCGSSGAPGPTTREMNCPS